MKLVDWHKSGKFFDFRKFQIYYNEKFDPSKQKEILLLIHGFPTASWDFHSIWNILSEQFNLLTLDMIGFGFSDKPSQFPYSIQEQANLMEDFLVFKGVKNYHILCHDYGVTVAQELLARFEDRQSIKTKEGSNSSPNILSIAFLNGGLFPETHRPRLVQKLLISPIGFLISRFLTKKKFAKSFSEVFGTNKPSHREIDDFWDLIQYNKGQVLAHKHIRYMKERKTNRPRWVGALLKTKLPLVLINGPKDPISGLHMVEHYRKLKSESNIILLADSIGHYPQVEDPEAVISAYLSFVNTLSIP
ncbi:MAG: alpha/beta hydrolase [Leptospiraceae bacterium]|nr:alpha/beta hydrolase [Leptospiraceae bacterium]